MENNIFKKNLPFVLSWKVKFENFSISKNNISCDEATQGTMVVLQSSMSNQYSKTRYCSNPWSHLASNYQISQTCWEYNFDT